MSTNKVELGSIISGTMLPEDLIPAFVDEILRIDSENGVALEIQEKMNNDEDYFESEDAIYDLNESLFDELNDLCDIPYSYFGSHPGDGADYGFWANVEQVSDDLRYGELKNVDDLEDDFLAVQINDHGNMTLMRCHIEYEEVWGVV
jgi:hypothetical protein